LKWLESEKRLKFGKTIDAAIQNPTQQEKQRWREILEILLAVILYLASHNMTLRGYRDGLEQERSGNFLDLVMFTAKFDPVLREHLQRTEDNSINNHYLGKKNIQNELIALMAKHVKHAIIQTVQQAKYYLIILDCIRDGSHTERLTILLDVDEKSGDTEEHFVGFIPVEKTAAEELTNCVLSEINNLRLDTKNCRGKGYDNDADVRGEESGEKIRTLNINPLAFFTPCGCHSWKLVLGDAAASCTKTRLFYSVLQRLYTLFSGSSNRWNLLKERVNITVRSLA
jgi:hypothetical protein